MTHPSLIGLCRRIGVAIAAGAILGATVMLGAAVPATAHDTAHCYHGNIYNGSWVTKFESHKTYVGIGHYNYYEHYYNGVYQHYESNECG